MDFKMDHPRAGPVNRVSPAGPVGNPAPAIHLAGQNASPASAMAALAAGSGWCRLDRDYVDDKGNSFSAGCCVHALATIGSGNQLHPYCVIGPQAIIGNGNEIGSFAIIAAPPQHRNAPKQSSLRIGDRCAIHPHSTIAAGTSPEGSLLGDDVIVMTGAHVGHDCRLGNGAVVGNYAQLGGHVAMDQDAVAAAFSCIVQRMILGAASHVLPRVVCRRDVWPFETLGSSGRRRMNSVGFRRRGGTASDAACIRDAWSAQWTSGLRERLNGLEVLYDVARAFEFMRRTAALRPPLRTRSSKVG